MEKKYYISYGSNLNKAQMERRCPTAVVAGTSVLRDYRLIFWSVATIEPWEGASVPVAIWEIDDECEESLDVYEGFPLLYRKEYLDVDLGGETVRAMVYIMNHGSPTAPNEYYYNTIRKGYFDMGLDTAPLEKALEDTIYNVD